MMGRLVPLLLVLAACSPRNGGGPDGAPAPSSEAARTDAPVITLERTPCLGGCPVYSLSISGDGLVRFVGRHHTDHAGEASARIPPERVDSLLDELRAGGYLEFADAYVHDAPACGRYATDSPAVITSAVFGNERKEIRHDYGCIDAPKALNALERRIDEVAGSSRWVGR